MADVNKKFERAAKDAQNLKKRPSDEDMLRLYALYKQASSGDVSDRRGIRFRRTRKYDARRLRARPRQGRQSCGISSSVSALVISAFTAAIATRWRSSPGCCSRPCSAPSPAARRRRCRVAPFSRRAQRAVARETPDARVSMAVAAFIVKASSAATSADHRRDARVTAHACWCRAAA
jgi:acyl-CoA-binding protein